MTEELPQLSQFFDAWGLFRDPTLTGTLAGATLGMLGVYVVLRRMVFLAAAVSQAASFGVAGTYYLKLHLAFSTVWAPKLGAFMMTLAALWLVASDKSHKHHRRDSLLGFVFLACASGTLVVGTRIVEEIQDIETVLFGTAVAVLPEDFHLMLGVSLAIAILHGLGWRGFTAVSFDRAGAVVRGLPVSALELVLFLSIGLALAVCTTVLGALPTFAFSVLPALAAVRIAPNVKLCLLIAAGIGAVSGFGGYVLAFLLEFPVGASQTLLAGLFVILTWPFGRHAHA